MFFLCFFFLFFVFFLERQDNRLQPSSLSSRVPSIQGVGRIKLALTGSMVGLHTCCHHTVADGGEEMPEYPGFESFPGIFV